MKTLALDDRTEKDTTDVLLGSVICVHKLISVPPLCHTYFAGCLKVYNDGKERPGRGNVAKYTAAH